MEIFIFYNLITGVIQEAGRINREKDEDNRDGSTTLEYVERKLTESPEHNVVYFINQDLPDPEKHKIVDGEIIKIANISEI